MRLLIISCSATKRDGRRKAVDLYDGPAYRTLRANLPQDVEVVILSALYGALGASHYIRPYDLKMTSAMARKFVEANRLWYLKERLRTESYSAIHVHASGAYREALEGIELDGATYSRGGIGEQLGQLKSWLREGASDVA